MSSMGRGKRIWAFRHLHGVQIPSFSLSITYNLEGLFTYEMP